MVEVVVANREDSRPDINKRRRRAERLLVEVERRQPGRVAPLEEQRSERLSRRGTENQPERIEAGEDGPALVGHSLEANAAVQLKPARRPLELCSVRLPQP